MKSPVGALAWPRMAPGYFDETVVERQIVSERVLPLLSVLAVVGKLVHDKLVDVAEREHFFVGRLDSHRRQSNVGIGRLLVTVR